jgi:signal transduction histidine kinase
LWYLLLLLWLFPATTSRTQDDDLSRAQIAEALPHLGQWIWGRQTFDKQIVRFWNAFVVPEGAAVSSAIIYITTDNSYRLLLDGREIGRGSDWRTITRYDARALLRPGEHILAVEAFNDRLAAGLIFGMDIEMPGRPLLKIVSDTSWRMVPIEEKGWEITKHAPAAWPAAVVQGKINQAPWTPWPYGVFSVPPLQPLILRFWQEIWFQVTLLSLLGAALLACLWLVAQLATQSKAQTLLQVERARIARDIHDDLSSRVTQLVLEGEIAQREQPADSPAAAQFNQLCERGRDLSRAMSEVVWAVNSRRDTVRDFVTHVCKHAGSFLASTSIRCRLDIEPEIPSVTFDLPTRRNLFLAVKEALNNAARHSAASELFLRIYHSRHRLVVVVEDNGRGFDPAQPGAGGNGLANMSQRLDEIGGTCDVLSQPGGGCRVLFSVPSEHGKRRVWFNWLRFRTPQSTPDAVTDTVGPASLPKP